DESRGAGDDRKAEGLAMTDLTVRQILDAFERGLEETRRQFERGEIRQDGRLDWPGWAGVEEKVTPMEKTPAINDITTRQSLQAIPRALDTVARRFAQQKPERMGGSPPYQPIE